MDKKVARGAGVGAVFGLGALACVGCCAAPLLIALGVSAGASAAIAMWTERVAQFAVVGVLIGGAVWFARRRFRARAASDCGDACAVDQSCGCSASDNTTSAGCTLPREDAPDRMQAFRELFDGRLRRTERRPGSVAFVFTDDEVTASRVYGLIEQESRCCSFLAFDVTREGGELRWTTRAGAEHTAVLETWAELPSLSGSPEGVSIAISRLGLREGGLAA